MSEYADADIKIIDDILINLFKIKCNLNDLNNNVFFDILFNPIILNVIIDRLSKIQYQKFILSIEAIKSLT